MFNLNYLIYIPGLLVALTATKVRADEYKISSDDSLFAIVTLKEGAFSKFAHNHLIVAQNYDAKIEVTDPTSPQGTFALTLPTKSLEVDNYELQKKWFPQFREMFLMTDNFTEVSKSDKKKIYDNMIDKTQLDVGAYPKITAAVSGIERSKGAQGNKIFAHAVKLALTVKGKTVEKKVPINLALDGQNLSAEAIGHFKFTEFGIKPYSAFMGAVKNQDTFYVYINVKAKKL